MKNQSPPAANVSFRTATPSDLAVLAALVKKYYEYDHIAYASDEVEAGLKTLLIDPSVGQTWLILCGSESVGYVIFTYGFDIEFGGRLATITDLYLEPGHRRQGIGSRLLEHVEAWCRSIGLRGLELQVERDNAEARALYTKFGFDAADRIPMSKRIGMP